MSYVTQMMIFSTNTSFWTKKVVIWWLERERTREKARYRWTILRSTNPATPKARLFISNCFELPSDWLLSYWEIQSEGKSKQLDFAVLGFVILNLTFLPENRQLKSIFILEQTEIVQTILFLDFLVRLPLKHVLCIEYVRSLHGLWFVHQKETDFFCFCVCQLQQ